jgi:hypothetical protein
MVKRQCSEISFVNIYKRFSSSLPLFLFVMEWSEMNVELMLNDAAGRCILLQHIHTTHSEILPDSQVHKI